MDNISELCLLISQLRINNNNKHNFIKPTVILGLAPKVNGINKNYDLDKIKYVNDLRYSTTKIKPYKYYIINNNFMHYTNSKLSP